MSVTLTGMGNSSASKGSTSSVAIIVYKIEFIHNSTSAACPLPCEKKISITIGNIKGEQNQQRQLCQNFHKK